MCVCARAFWYVCVCVCLVCVRVKCNSFIDIDGGNVCLCRMTQCLVLCCCPWVWLLVPPSSSLPHTVSSVPCPLVCVSLCMCACVCGRCVRECVSVFVYFMSSTIHEQFNILTCFCNIFRVFYTLLCFLTFLQVASAHLQPLLYGTFRAKTLWRRPC